MGNITVLNTLNDIIDETLLESGMADTCDIRLRRIERLARQALDNLERPAPPLLPSVPDEARMYAVKGLVLPDLLDWLLGR
jgi:hypothetical protein